jgi:transcriptional antiterminator RfaH
MPNTANNLEQSSSEGAGPEWYCLKTPPKKENIAAAHLRQISAIEDVFSPTLRYKKHTRRGRIWFAEALFPGYLFSKFDFTRTHRLARYAHGVSGIVHFGDVIPWIDAQIVESLRAQCRTSGKQDLFQIDPSLREGDEVTIAEGPFEGIKAVVRRLYSGQERVRILLEFMNKQIEAELSQNQLIPEKAPRERTILYSG